MKKKLSTILAVLMIAMFTISVADAGPGIKISSADFSLGSLIADGTLNGTDKATVTVVLTAEGTCTIDGETGPVFANDSQVLLGNEENEESEEKNTKRQFYLEAYDLVRGCSNDTEGSDGFVFWTKATISVYNGAVCGESCEGFVSSANKGSNNLLDQQVYACSTSFEAHTVACTPVKNSGSNNGTAICHATGSKKNPYVLLTVKVNALNGHSKHTGDIIPAPANGCPN